MEEQFDEEIHALAQQIKGMHDQAVAVYTPLVDDICSRIAPMKEVEWLWITCLALQEKSACCCYTKEFAAIIGKYIRK